MCNGIVGSKKAKTRVCGYFREEELEKTGGIRVFPPLSGFASQRAAIILAERKNLSLGAALWQYLLEYAETEEGQQIIERAIAHEQKALDFQGRDSSYVDAARSLILSSGVYKLKGDKKEEEK
ncbi:MAG: hypothetical protein F6K14_26765 [Symploca sp. SIO2C1]|nr:hypothetical protein [Symploca sp. SIO2C1]